MPKNKNFNIDSIKVKKVKNCFYTIGDCIGVMSEMKAKSVNTIVTSPPYNLDKKYGKYNDNRPLEEWESLIDDLAKGANRILTDDGSFLLNVSPIPDKKTKEIIPLDAIAYYIFKKKNPEFPYFSSPFRYFTA